MNEITGINKKLDQTENTLKEHTIVQHDGYCTCRKCNKLVSPGAQKALKSDGVYVVLNINDLDAVISDKFQLEYIATSFDKAIKYILDSRKTYEIEHSLVIGFMGVDRDTYKYSGLHGVDPIMFDQGDGWIIDEERLHVPKDYELPKEFGKIQE